MGYTEVYSIITIVLGVMMGYSMGLSYMEDTSEDRLHRIQALELDIYGEILSKN